MFYNSIISNIIYPNSVRVKFTYYLNHALHFANITFYYATHGRITLIWSQKKNNNNKKFDIISWMTSFMEKIFYLCNKRLFPLYFTNMEIQSQKGRSKKYQGSLRHESEIINLDAYIVLLFLSPQKERKCFPNFQFYFRRMREMFM